MRTHAIIACTALLLACGDPQDVSDETRAQRTTDDIVGALGSAATKVDVVATDEWTWTKVDYCDDLCGDHKYPLRIDIVVSNRSDAGRALYAFPGSGTSFESSFFFPHDRNIVHFMRNRGYVVIGITARGLALTPDTANLPVVATWGMERLREDAHSVIAKIQRVVPRPYDLLGHSLGAFHALDYAAKYPDEPQKLFLLDEVVGYDPVNEPALVALAQAYSDTYQGMLDAGAFSMDLIGMFRVPTTNALDPATADAASPIPRPAGGNFTWAGFAHFLIVDTGLVPSLALVESFCAGTYTFDATDPRKDTFSLAHTTMRTIADAFAASGGYFPVAQWRDAYAAIAGNGRYVIPFAKIRAKVSWVNAAQGWGNHPYVARLIEAGGNRSVRYSVVPGYGHLDVLASDTAEADVWSVLVGD